MHALRRRVFLNCDRLCRCYLTSETNFQHILKVCRECLKMYNLLQNSTTVDFPFVFEWKLLYWEVLSNKCSKSLFSLIKGSWPSNQPQKHYFLLRLSMTCVAPLEQRCTKVTCLSARCVFKVIFWLYAFICDPWPRWPNVQYSKSIDKDSIICIHSLLEIYKC